ncbi:MAG: Polysaccharide biosynthesis protein [Parcubacteria group bacterium GW2011_GWA2_51_10]|nr:MAG: Polysaccharide biosynthesis protein [Parcubacteria group bacterium GW2011_GWA2_51_10]
MYSKPHYAECRGFRNVLFEVACDAYRRYYTHMLTSMKNKSAAFLRRLDPYMKTDVMYLATGGFWLMLGQIVGTAAGLALTLVFGNFVSKEVFGNYKYVLSLAGIFGAIALTGMGSAVTQAVARGFDGALREGFRTYLQWSIPSMFATLAGAVYYWANDNNVLALSLFIVALGSPVLNACNLYTSFLQGKKDFRRNTIYGFLISSTPPLLLIATMLAGYVEWVPLFVLIYYIAMIAPSAYFHMRTRALYRPSNVIDVETAPYAWHLSLINVLGRIAAYIDKVLVFHFLGAAPLAIYTFASAPPQYVLKFNGIFRTLALPKLAARDIPTLKATLPRKIALHFAVALAVLGVYEILVSPFFRFFLPQYIDAIPYAWALGLTILSAPGVWLGQTLIAHMKKRALYFMNTVSPIIKMGLYVSLIPIYGIWGVVVATVASGFIGFMIAAIIFKRL